MSRLLKSTFCSIFLFSFLFITAHAQSGGISIQIQPEFPRPNSLVTISAQSLSVNIESGLFTWYVNGKVFKKGKGLNSIQVTSGKSGVATKVSVTISEIGMGTVTKEISFRPTDVTLLWESDGYTPPFYKGKALETYGSEFKVTAIPEFFTSGGTRINPKTLVYTWKKNGTVDPEQSGYGKDVYSGRQTSYTRGEDEISVLVSTPTDDVSSGQRVSIVPGIPEIIFYENSPLYGVLYHKALLDRHVLGAEEFTLHASLFDISTPRTYPEAGPILIEWSLNGTPITTYKNKPEIIFRKTRQGAGESNIEINVQHQDRLLQGGQANITILQ